MVPIDTSDCKAAQVAVTSFDMPAQSYAIGGQEFARVPDVLKLECIEGPNQGTSYSKPGALLTVGRTSKSKIHIPDASISEKHGQLEWNGAVWLVQDVGSSNGTTVNGNSLVANGTKVELKDMDIVTFGSNTKLRVQVTPVPEESVTVAQYLESECGRHEKHIAAKLEQMASKLRQDWTDAQKDVLQQTLRGTAAA